MTPTSTVEPVTDNAVLDIAVQTMILAAKLAAPDPRR